METLEEKQIKVSGTLKKFKANKHGDIDSLELVSTEGPLNIKFPAHMAKKLMDSIRPEEHVDLVYHDEKDNRDKGDKPKLKLDSVLREGKPDLEIMHTHPQKPDHEVTEKLTFDNFELIKGKKGELTGIKSGNNLVHIHKKDEALSEMISDHDHLQIEAVKRTDPGFVNEKGDNVFHFSKIRIGDKDYQSKESK